MPLYQGIQLIIERRERLAPAELRNDSLALHRRSKRLHLADCHLSESFEFKTPDQKSGPASCDYVTNSHLCDFYVI